MKSLIKLGIILGFITIFNIITPAQKSEVYSGTLVSFGQGFNTRTRTTTFTLRINGKTSADELNRLTAVLQEGGQDELLKALQNYDLGSFSVGGNIGRRLHAVTSEEVDGKIRIRAIFERWMSFTELRGGYRSVDYPFGYIELFIDPRTGKGEGTLIEAAQIRWKKQKSTGDFAVEIENFATYPAKLLAVSKVSR
jgi:hypothetical protein